MAQRRQFIAVVTASTGFHDRTQNPSQKVKTLLPDEVVSSDGSSSLTIIKYPRDLRNVITDEEIVPKLWNQKRQVYFPDAADNEKIYVDTMIHIGMVPDKERWDLIRGSVRDGYHWTGDDGVPLPKHNGVNGEWEGQPERLTTIYDVDSLVESAKATIGVTDDKTVIAPNDGGREYCGFTYYTSLATLYRRKERTRVMFLHVPGSQNGGDDEIVDRGVKVVTATLKGMLDQLSRWPDS